MNQVPLAAQIVHKSLLVNQPEGHKVHRLMLNLVPQGRLFEPGTDIALGATDDQPVLRRRYTIESVGEVPFEDSIDITVFVREPVAADAGTVARELLQCAQGDSVAVYGPYPNPFYPPVGSRSNMILIGAGTGMVPFRWLARKIQSRGLDWMGKVLMLEGGETGLETQYLNRALVDADQYFDEASRRAFEALKTRYSAVASDAFPSPAANREALWRLMGQGSVYVYLAGYRRMAEALDAAMAEHLRLAGRWEEAKSALQKNGHWLEFLYE
jgi:ferredoxin-NADP reductase